MAKKTKRRQKNQGQRYRPSSFTHAISKTYKREVRPREVIDPNKVWYVISIRQAREPKARTRLKAIGIPFYFPNYTEMVVRKGRRVDAVRQLFVRYGFVGLDPDTLRFDLVRDTEGVDGILAVDGAPIRVPASVLQRISDELTGNSEDVLPLTPLDRLAIGQLMRVTEGPFAALLARIEDIHRNGSVRASVSLFGRETPIVFGLDQLEAAE